MSRKNKAYIGFGTICGFRHPGGLGRYPTPVRGGWLSLVADNMMDNFQSHLWLSRAFLIAGVHQDSIGLSLGAPCVNQRVKLQISWPSHLNRRMQVIPSLQTLQIIHEVLFFLKHSTDSVWGSVLCPYSSLKLLTCTAGPPCIRKYLTWPWPTAL